MYLLDTNVISELRRPRPHGAVLEWISGIEARHLLVPSIVVGEIQIGIERVRVKDPAKAAELSQWLLGLMAGGQFLDPGPAIFQSWAVLIAFQTPNKFVDALIAATALHHDLTVVTRNVRDFEPFGIRIVNPFDHSGGKAR